jgi:hypothetical protein
MTDTDSRLWPAHSGNDDVQHDEEPAATDALAHTDMDWNDLDQDRAATRQEARQEHRRRLDETEDDYTPDGLRYLPGSGER